jgi:hypothetical protein
MQAEVPATARGRVRYVGCCLLSENSAKAPLVMLSFSVEDAEKELLLPLQCAVLARQPKFCPQSTEQPKALQRAGEISYLRSFS